MNFVLVIFLLFIQCSAKRDGAPETACLSMAPIHYDRSDAPIKDKQSPPPYTVKAVESGGKVNVTISSPYDEKFKGFMLQARSKDDDKLVEGKFSQHQDSKAIDCSEGKQNTLTHVAPNEKSEIMTVWVPSKGLNEEIIFRATVVKVYHEFWIGINSTPVKIISRGQPSDSQSNPVKMDTNVHPMYEGCGVTKNCFGYKTGCVGKGDCEVLLSFSKVTDGIFFKLQGFLDSSMYMAMALSTDALMGDDSVTECFRENSNVFARLSYNTPKVKDNGQTKDLPRDRYEGSFSEGLTSCSWTSPFFTQSNGQVYDFENKTYHVLLAKGRLSKRELGYHYEAKIASGDPINFTSLAQIDEAGVSDAIKVHGCFMITAWIGFVSLGILLARHFKNTWENSHLCGVKIWFAFHRTFMITALVLVIIAFIVIFVHKGGWNYQTQNPHAILGCIATALGLLQPIMAAFRPAPDHPKRIVFNFLHTLVGNAAQIIAVVTIFFAKSLGASGLKDSFYWVMAIFVIVHVIFHFMLQVHSWTSGKKKNPDVGLNEMSATARAHNIAQNVEAKNITDNVFRILLLGIYGIFLLVILLALYALIGVA